MNASESRRNPPPRPRGPRAQRGVGLIEILIAVVIISLGFLAAARMQVDSMRYSQSAYYRSQAYFMASAMIDRMRANVDGVRQLHYEGIRTSSSALDPSCDVAACTPAQIAQQDLYDWSASLHSNAEGSLPLLPSVENIDAYGEVTRDDDGRYTVRLVWGEIVDGDPTGQELSVDFVPEV